MSQPEWEKVWSTDHEVLYRDTTGVYPPELEHAEENEDGTFTVYRVCLDKCTLGEDGRLIDVIDYKGVPHNPWFEDDKHVGAARGCEITGQHYCPAEGRWRMTNLSGAAGSCDIDVEDLRRKFCSDNPSDLAHAYEVIYGYHGWDNGDSDPWTFTGDELDKRWGVSTFGDGESALTEEELDAEEDEDED